MASSESISFPDGPRSQLEVTIEQLVVQAARVLDTQGRLRSLLHANRLVVEGLELAEVLRRIVAAAVELVDARYGALGVIGPDGKLEQFIQVGLSPEQADAIGALPLGHGILGAVIDEAGPIRLEHLGNDPRAVGFPSHHPAMDAFLGVPIRVRGQFYGNLYLTEPAAGSFTFEDEELVGALADTAGIAIDNARLFEIAQQREHWSAALADVSSALLSGDSDALPVVVEHVATLIDADLVAVIVEGETPDTLTVAAARGDDAARVREQKFPVTGSLAGRALASGQPLLIDRPDAHQVVEGEPVLGPTVVVPLAAFGHSIGALSVSRQAGRRPFTETDLAMASEFGAQASVALELARGRLDREQIEKFADRSRIARDLHDHVIQRLFGAGLGLQSIAARSPAVRDVLLEQVDVIDAAISEIRTVVFALSAAHSSEGSLRHRVLDIVGEASAGLANPATISFSGPVDLLVRDDRADAVAAVVRESLINVARHADAAHCAVEVAVEGDELWVRVDDDGVGFVAGSRASGTVNLASRATQLGGSYVIEAGPEGGTRVLWRVPLGDGVPG